MDRRRQDARGSAACRPVAQVVAWAAAGGSELGTALMANCLTRRTPWAVMLGTLGFGLFNRALSGRRGGIEVQKTIEIKAPVDRAY